ncbi:MAG: class IIb bacteriocin, lactobin A/cerein 7B family [Glaciecola sp.]|jgi:lactobin A/cerein 7B family class IIb bacteriocin|nr:class IIb bacteriocin, lactobin A/cerein 7B family [Glaciecola sp.]MDG2098873.1 class IIb bacteriocin, lactobin A/cerein 7B family [Glaciecola sp.]
MKELNNEELMDVHGGIGIVGAGFGGVLGGISYLGNAATSGSFSWGGFGSAVGVGAISGAVGGPVGSSIVKYGLSKVSFYGGAAQGLIND